MIRNFEVWNTLPSTVLHSVEGMIERRQYKRGDFIYRAEETPRGLYFVNRGLIGLVAYGQNGQEHLLRLFRERQILGHRSLFGHDKYHASAQALEESEVGLLPKDIVEDLIKTNPQLAITFLEIMAREIRNAEQRMMALTDLDVTSRVVEALLFLRETHKTHRWTRKEIADFCGSTTATVIKVLVKLKEEGLVEFIGREIKIVDRDRLLKLIHVVQS